MRATGNSQANTKTYWNYIYTTPAKEKGYWAKTFRFDYALEEVKDGDKFMDLGCGVGIPGRRVLKERKNCEIWGTDISTEIIERNKKDNDGIKYFAGYIGYQEFLPKDYFDVVFCGEVIEHMDDPLFLFKEAYRILKKGGKLIITTPRDEAILSNEHVWFFTEDDVQDLYHKAKFKDIIFRKLPNTEHLAIIFAVGIK